MKHKILFSKFVKIIINIVIMLYSIFCIYPIVWMIYSSFKTNAEFNQDIMSLPQSLNWSNYVTAFKIGKMNSYAINSVFNAIIATGIVLLLSFVIGYFLARFKFRGRSIIYGFFMFGMLVPIHALLVPLFTQFKFFDLFDKRFTLIIPYVAFAMPFSVFLTTSYIKGIPKELEEAAIIDGASFPRILFSIIFPVARPILVTIGILKFFSNWNEFPFALVLLSSEKYKTIPIGLQNFSGQYSTDYPIMLSGLVLATIPLIIIYVLFYKKIIEGMTSGAVKG